MWPFAPEILEQTFFFSFSSFFFFGRIIVYGLCAEWKDKMRWYRYRGVEWMDQGKYYVGQFRPPALAPPLLFCTVAHFLSDYTRM